jgi:hypothetical protein
MQINSIDLFYKNDIAVNRSFFYYSVEQSIRIYP